jgi:hypothetical protein
MPRSTVQEMLAQQLGFLKSSLQAYKVGNDAESLRMATTLRVLIHDTTKSHALLKQIDPNYLNLTILDRPDFSSGRKILVLYGIGVSRSGDGTGTARPDMTLNDPALQLTPLEKWWNRLVLVFTDSNGQHVEFTRRNLVLTLVNKEGGAHVDPTIPVEYEKYVLDAAVPFIVNGVPTDSAHLAQFATVEAAVRMIECLERNFPWLPR